MSGKEQENNPSHELSTWGVGPWQGDWPDLTDSVYDEELLANGDTRNVVDKYRYWKMEAIVKDLDSKRHEFHVAIENWKKENLPIIAIDNVEGCKKIEKFKLPKACVFLFGQEGPGLSDEAIKASDVVLEITQFGSTRSINASAAAAITMHAWVQQHVFNQH